MDETSARATFTDGPFTLTLLFRFNDAGLLNSAHAAARGALVGKQVLMLPRKARWSNYPLRNGMTLPMCGQASWVPARRNACFRSEVTLISFEFAA